MKQASALVTKDCSKPLCIKCNQKMVLKENWNIQNVNVCHTLYGRRFENLQLCANCYQCVLLVQFGLPSSNQSEEAKMLMLCWTGEWTWKSDLVQETANSLKIWMTWQQIETKIRWVVVGHKNLPRSRQDSPHYQSHLFFSFHLKRRKKNTFDDNHKLWQQEFHDIIRQNAAVVPSEVFFLVIISDTISELQLFPYKGKQKEEEGKQPHLHAVGACEADTLGRI